MGKPQPGIATDALERLRAHIRRHGVRVEARLALLDLLQSTKTASSQTAATDIEDDIEDHVRAVRAADEALRRDLGLR